MSNKDLLKQAIAEAKTIREAAIANAKEALEETLTPHLKEMLAQKLQEMEEDEMDEYGMEHNDRDMDGDGDVDAEDTSVKEAKEKEEEAPAEEEGEEAEEKEEGEEEEELEIEDMTVEDLKDLIRDIVAQEVGHDEEAEMETGEEAPEGEEDMVSMDGDSEEIDINELLAELEGEQNVEEGLGSFIKGGIEKLDQKIGSMQAAAKKKGEESKFIQGLDKAVGATQQAVGPGKGYNSGAKYESIQEEDEDMEEGLGSMIKGGLEKLDQKIARMQAAAKKKGEESKFIQGLDKAVGATQQAVGPGKGYSSGAKYESVQEDLNEALQTISVLKNQLQEVNLLNAKLLYVNKVFKANNLSEGQKVNVIAAFDKAETVKEVKLVFETVSKNVVTKPAAIREHKSFASKATGNAQTTAPKQILSEVDEQVARWQKLAGIIKS
jgi:hypothetical protein